MELLIIIVNKEEYFEKILSILVELGASEATIFDSEAIGHFLAYKIPIFAGLRHLMGERKSANKTIMTLIDKKETFEEFKSILLEENIDFTHPGIGIILTLPINNFITSENE